MPHQLLKIVTTESTDKDAARITLYRLGEKYARLQIGSELIVVSEPDIWMAELPTMTGKHTVDGGEPVFHAVIFGEIDSKLWSQLEFGCEVAFMKAVKAATEPRDGGGTRYTHASDGVRVTLDVDAKEIPKSIAIAGSKRDLTLTYVEYGPSDAKPEELFAKPQGVRFGDPE